MIVSLTWVFEMTDGNTPEPNNEQISVLEILATQVQKLAETVGHIDKTMVKEVESLKGKIQNWQFGVGVLVFVIGSFGAVAMFPFMEMMKTSSKNEKKIEEVETALSKRIDEIYTVNRTAFTETVDLPFEAAFLVSHSGIGAVENPCVAYNLLDYSNNAVWTFSPDGLEFQEAVESGSQAGFIDDVNARLYEFFQGRENVKNMGESGLYDEFPAMALDYHLCFEINELTTKDILKIGSIVGSISRGGIERHFSANMKTRADFALFAAINYGQPDCKVPGPALTFGGLPSAPAAAQWPQPPSNVE